MNYTMSKALERPQALSIKRFHSSYTSPNQKAMTTKRLRQQEAAKEKPQAQVIQRQNSTTATLNTLVKICQQLPDDVLVKVLATATSELKQLRNLKPQ